MATARVVLALPIHIGSRIGWVMQQPDERAVARLRPAELPMAWAAPDAHRPLQMLGLELEQDLPGNPGLAKQRKHILKALLHLTVRVFDPAVLGVQDVARRHGTA